MRCGARGSLCSSIPRQKTDAFRIINAYDAGAVISLHTLSLVAAWRTTVPYWTTSRTTSTSRILHYRIDPTSTCTSRYRYFVRILATCTSSYM